LLPYTTLFRSVDLPPEELRVVLLQLVAVFPDDLEMYDRLAHPWLLSDDLGCLDRGLCRNSSLAYHAADAGLVADRQARRRAAARTAPRRADRLLLPDARLPVRGGGRRPGNARSRLAEPRQLRGPGLTALVALPDRDQRLPRHAGRPRATRPADAARTPTRAGPVEPE